MNMCTKFNLLCQQLIGYHCYDEKQYFFIKRTITPKDRMETTGDFENWNEVESYRVPTDQV